MKYLWLPADKFDSSREVKKPIWPFRHSRNVKYEANKQMEWVELLLHPSKFNANLSGGTMRALSSIFLC